MTHPKVNDQGFYEVEVSLTVGMDPRWFGSFTSEEELREIFLVRAYGIPGVERVRASVSQKAFPPL